MIKFVKSLSKVGKAKLVLTYPFWFVFASVMWLIVQAGSLAEDITCPLYWSYKAWLKK